MAQTRRKRRSKHRGTAAGMIETRGRTGRKPTPQERAGGKKKAPVHEPRWMRKASWRNSVIRAALAALFLFGLTRLGLGGDMTMENSILFASLAFAVYVPLGYYMDSFIQQRREKQQKRKAALAKSMPRDSHVKSATRDAREKKDSR